MIPIEVAVKSSKRLEGLLEKRFGASGRGLHDKLTSVEDRIPEEIRRSIRWVATIRNKVVHEEGPAPAEESEFVRTVDRVARQLEAPTPAGSNARPKSTSKSTSKAKPTAGSKSTSKARSKSRATGGTKRGLRDVARPRRAVARTPRTTTASPRPGPRPRAWVVTILLFLVVAGLVWVWNWRSP